MPRSLHRVRLVLLLLVLSAPIVWAARHPGREDEQAATSKVVHVTAERFSFTPSEIAVDQGTVLEIRLTSEDTAHGFRLVGPQGAAAPVDVEIPKRGRGDIRVRFDATEPGTYTFECSRICGAGHNFMRGVVKVRPKDGGR